MPMNKKIGKISDKIHSPYEWMIGWTTPSEITKSVTGQNSITLTNAIANELLEVKAYGWLEQSKTPTPSDPATLTCNNWILKVSGNILDMSEENIVLWKYIDNSGIIQDSSQNFYNSKYISVAHDEIYTRSTSRNVRYVSIMEYDINKTFIKRTLFNNGTYWKNSWSLTIWSTTAFVLFWSNPLYTDITMDDIFLIDRQFEKSSVWTAQPEYWIYADGTQEVIEDSLWNSGLVENLLSISSSKDEQEILTWNIIHHVWVKILDWSENWTQVSSPLWNIFQADLLDQNMFSHLVCSHFANDTPLHDEIIYKSAGSSIVQIRYDTATTVQEFIQFLIWEYTSWNPVLVVYWLQHSKQEKVDWQTLDIQTGTNTIEITDASIDPLTLSAKYKATP